MIGSTTYLLSSFIKNPDFFFQGYCFVGNDYIYGLKGALDYKKNTGIEIATGEDGCYVLAKKINNNYIFGSDNSGYKKILYFKDELSGVWAVSNSLNLLIEHLKENDIKLTPNFPHLMAMAKSPTPTQQPISFSTVANEIKLLPLNTYLTIGENTLRVQKIYKASMIDKSYKELLKDFVQTWSSRLSTLLSDKRLVIEQALTGGVDSRSVFSLTELAKKNLSSPISADHYLNCGLTRGDTRDIDVAEKISNFYNYELNPERNNYKGRIKLNSWQRYKEWKDVCLGTYAPVYFPSLLVSPLHTSIGGGGGENHRPFYASYLDSNDYKKLIASVCKGIDDPIIKMNISNDMYATFSKLTLIDGVDEEALLISHYKNFRNRFHIGLFPQYRVTFTPLSSNLLDKLASQGNMDKIRSSQLLYDLMNQVKGLIDFPFDNVDKSATIEQLKELTYFSDDLDIKVGKCYLDTTVPEFLENEGDSAHKTPLIYLKHDFDIACKTNIVKKLWSQEFIDDAKKVMEESICRGKLPYAADGRSISAIISTSLFE